MVRRNNITKKILIGLLTFSLLCSNCCITSFASEAEEAGLENSWRYHNGTLISDGSENGILRANSTATTYMPSVHSGKKGVDVSEHNQDINWEKVKASGVEFAIIRCGYGQDYPSQDDKRWQYNVSECERLGIPYGVYLYSYATTVEAASSEADHVLRLLKGHTPAYPVYYDMEDNSTIGVGNERLGQIAKTFCSKISAAGYAVGVYANQNWWENYLTSSVFDNSVWSKWVAQYPYVSGDSIACAYQGRFDMWQFTSKGVIDGIGSNVDLNYWVADSVPSTNAAKISYSTHVQTYGWEKVAVTDGATSGTTGLGKRLEAIKIHNQTGYSGNIEYRVHCQTYGWMNWVSNGQMAGTNGEKKRLEAIQIRLTGELAEKYDVYYRVHAQTYGWLGWAKNGAEAGTSGFAKRLEGIQIMLVDKGNVPGEGTLAVSYVQYGKTATNGSDAGLINYQTHVQTYGNQSYVYDGSLAGTFNEAKRLEGIRINVNTDKLGVTGGVEYKTHVQSYGWQDWVSNGALSGTSGKAKRLEAIRIQLTGELAEKYDVYYRVHAQTYGWLGWAKNGEAAGTEGLAKRLEAIQIVLVPKNGSAPNYLPAVGNTGAFIK